jgi:hypothetical protein
MDGYGSFKNHQPVLYQVAHLYKVTGTTIVLIYDYSLLISTLQLGVMLPIVECVFNTPRS